jgi:hypothetical protein
MTARNLGMPKVVQRGHLSREAEPIDEEQPGHFDSMYRTQQLDILGCPVTYTSISQEDLTQLSEEQLVRCIT